MDRRGFVEFCVYALGMLRRPQAGGGDAVPPGRLIGEEEVSTVSPVQDVLRCAIEQKLLFECDEEETWQRFDAAVREGLDLLVSSDVIGLYSYIRQGHEPGQVSYPVALVEYHDLACGWIRVVASIDVKSVKASS
jgi:hypothetical protein